MGVADDPRSKRYREWLTPGVRGIGAASLLADLGHEIPTALLPSFLSATLGAPASALGLIEGIADGVAGATRLAGGALADDPSRRRTIAVGGYASTALLSALVGVGTSIWQVGMLRTGAWAARGLRVPSRNALLADVVPPGMYGRAYGFERAMDNLGAIGGPLLALLLVSLAGVRTAILLSILPGLLAVLAILYAIKHTPRPERREHQPIKLKLRPVLQGRLGRLMIGVSIFELGNLAATLLILRATDLLTPGHGSHRATQIAIALYVVYNLAATLTSIPAGHLGDRNGQTGVFALGVAAFGLAYTGFAIGGTHIRFLGLCFAAAGIGIGCAETAEHAAVATLAPDEIKGSAFGLLAATQSIGNLTASATVGLLYTITSPTIAFAFAATMMLISLAAIALARN